MQKLGTGDEMRGAKPRYRGPDADSAWDRVSRRYFINPGMASDWPIEAWGNMLSEKEREQLRNRPANIVSLASNPQTDLAKARDAVDELKLSHYRDELELVARNPKTPREVALYAVEALGAEACWSPKALVNLKRLLLVPDYVSERARQILNNV